MIDSFQDGNLLRINFKAIDCGHEQADKLPADAKIEIPFLEDGIPDDEPWGLVSIEMGRKLVAIPAPETIVTEVELVVQTI